MSFSPDGKWLSAFGDLGDLQVWSWPQGVEWLHYDTGEESDGFAFLPDRKAILLGDGKRLVFLDGNLGSVGTAPARILAEAERESGLKLVGFELREEAAPDLVTPAPPAGESRPAADAGTP